MAVQVKPGPKDLLDRVGPEMYRAAYEKGVSLSAYVDMVMDPADKGKMDGFSRLLQVADIKLWSDHSRGIYADEFRVLEKSDSLRNLAPEIVSRFWRRAQGMRSYMTEDDILNTVARPYSDNLSPRGPRLEPAIPLNELVALTTPIDSDAYRTMYLETSATETRMVRVNEATELPPAKLSSREQVVRLYKFGRAIDISYELLRRMRFDKLAFHIAQMAIQAESDKVAAIADVLVNGDGNANTAAEVFQLAADLGGTANALSIRYWLKFKFKFQNPYALTTALVQEDPALDLAMLNYGSANMPMNAVNVGIGGFSLINKNLADGVRLGITSDAPAHKIVGFDNRLAVERVTETGSNISEIQRWATKQTQTLTFSEVEGYAILDNDAAKILKLDS